MVDSRIEAIAIRPESRGAMTELTEAQVTPQDGVIGDFRRGVGPRQVTVLAVEAWRATCADLGTDLPWLLRRANLLVRGINLADTAGAHLRIGEIILQVTGETKPCGRMDEQQPDLRQALVPDWRGGVCCRVQTGGTVRIADRVALEPARG